MTPIDLITTFGGSVAAGALIGLEREFRGRPAGLRTHTLVCLASTMLMLAATQQGVGTYSSSPARTSSPILRAWPTAF